jgi:glycosyltransferase involved in cell wall biosynthesis
VKLLIDAQCIQSTSSLRGIGRYALCLTRALSDAAPDRGDSVEVLLAAGGDPDRLMRARRAIESFLPPRRVHVFDAPWAWTPPYDRRRRPLAEAAYAAAVESLQPDALLVGSIFEGDLETVLSVGASPADPPTAAILFDLIPAIEPKTYLLGPGADVYWRRMEDLKRCRSLVAISEHSAQQAASVLGAASPAVSPVWGGPYPSGRFPSFEQQHDEVQHLKLPERFVLSVGGDHPRKNLDRLVLAWGTVPSTMRRETPLVIACRLNSGTVRRLRGVAARAGVAPDELVLAGGVSESTLRALYDKARAFVFPSLQEGLGLPPLESMAAGCPTVMAHGSSLSELSDEPVSFFDGESVPSIARALELAVGDESTRSRLTDAGRRSSERFTWERAAELAWDALEAIEPSPPRQAGPQRPVVRYSDTASVMRLPDEPAPLTLDVALRGGSPVGRLGLPIGPRAEIAGATAVVTSGHAAAVVQAGVLDQPLLEEAGLLPAAAAHDFYAAYARRLPAGAKAHEDVIAEAVQRTPRWMLERPRRVWMLVAEPHEDWERLLSRADADLVRVGPEALGLGEFADGLLVSAHLVTPYVQELHRVRRKGACVVALQPPTAEVPVPDWCASLPLPGAGAQHEAAFVDQVSQLLPKTTGWPWRG